MANKYQKPKCICGGKIVIVNERTHEIYRNINLKGQVNEREYTHNSDVGISGAEWLECFDCGKEFNVDYDYKNKIILGEAR